MADRFEVVKPCTAFDFTTQESVRLHVYQVLTLSGFSDKGGLFTDLNGHELSLDFDDEKCVKKIK